MKNNRVLRNYPHSVAGALLGAVLLLGSGCVQRDLEIRPDEGYVKITLNWSAAGAAARDARFLFYDEAGALVREVENISDVYVGTFPLGTYRMVVHNMDAGAVDWRGCERYESAEVYALPTDYTTDHHPGEGVACIREPQEIFGAGGCNETDRIVVEQLDTTYLTVTPTALTRRVSVRFLLDTDVPVEGVKGVLGGVAHGYFPGQGCHNAASSCAVEFEAQPETRAAVANYAAGVNVFGLLTQADSPEATNTVHLGLTFTDGTAFADTVDITPTIRQLMETNGGTLPAEIPLSIVVRRHATWLGAAVVPWDESGEGGGDPRPQPRNGSKE